MGGPMPITYESIYAYQQVSGVDLTGEELHGILAIDAAYCVAAQCKVETPKGNARERRR